ncbi:MAG: sterol desaturase family protein [Sphingomicrobium sp.]
MTGLHSTNGAIDAEPLIRLSFVIGVFALLMAWEFLAPRRQLTLGRRRRWPGNVGIVVIDTVVIRLLFPTAAVGLALVAEDQGWGVLNMVAVPDWLAILLAIVLLDLAIYAQHVMFHRVPLLWRLHRMHHADLDIDVTTGVRFHPVEILLSMVIKIAVVMGLGAPALAVLIFEVLLNATSMFNHSNVWMPAGVDRLLRRILVTPDMHRVHHSIVARETHSNFGFNLPWWDRMFGTYRAQPEVGHEAMTIGLDQFRDESELRLDRLLLQPLRRANSEGNAG